MADPDEALIEAIAEAITDAENDSLSDPTGEYTIPTSAGDWMVAARAAYTAIVAHLGLVEERAREVGPGVNRPMRRLVSKWVEVDHGSE